MRIRGVGVDVLNYSRFQHIYNFYDDQGIKKIFTPFEIEVSQKHTNLVKYFSARFAAKEAILKSLSINLDLIKYTDIEIYSNEFNKPYVRLLGDIKSHSQLQGIHQIEISLSYEENCVIAYAITTEKEEA